MCVCVCVCVCVWHFTRASVVRRWAAAANNDPARSRTDTIIAPGLLISSLRLFDDDLLGSVSNQNLYAMSDHGEAAKDRK
jgi:hypothetical protein